MPALLCRSLATAPDEHTALFLCRADVPYRKAHEKTRSTKNKSLSGARSLFCPITTHAHDFEGELADWLTWQVARKRPKQSRTNLKTPCCRSLLYLLCRCSRRRPRSADRSGAFPDNRWTNLQHETRSSGYVFTAVYVPVKLNSTQTDLPLQADDQLRRPSKYSYSIYEWGEEAERRDIISLRDLPACGYLSAFPAVQNFLNGKLQTFMYRTAAALRYRHIYLQVRILLTHYYTVNTRKKFRKKNSCRVSHAPVMSL